MKTDIQQYNFDGLVAGCDEAGRGCLAGPVFAAAVILPPGFSHPFLNDSKMLRPEKRAELRVLIESKALYYAVGKVKEKEIDHINILNASFKAMHKAINKLSVRPDLILVDGNRFNPYKKIPHRCIIKGDSKYYSIAAASILAKEYRDQHMLRLSKKHPNYAWQSNMGYPTQAHRAAIKAFGTTPFHRMSFKLLKED